MGSRYGGLKQIDPVGPNGETIMDYSIYDAIKAGFGKIVFVIRRGFADAFKDRIEGKIKGAVETAYAYQELESCLDGFAPPVERQKPWGTGHAVLVARELINEPFAVINADDYYGPNSYKILYDNLAKKISSPGDDYSMVGFRLRNTLSDFGHVSRGICECDKDMFLQGVTEREKIFRRGDEAVFVDPSGHEQRIDGDETVSMNFWGFGQDIFDLLEGQFKEFLATSGGELKSEFYIPLAIDELVKQGRKRVKVLQTPDKWFGVTYKEDKQNVQAAVAELIKQGLYPHKLW